MVVRVVLASKGLGDVPSGQIFEGGFWHVCAFFGGGVCMCVGGWVTMRRALCRESKPGFQSLQGCEP